MQAIAIISKVAKVGRLDMGDLQAMVSNKVMIPNSCHHASSRRRVALVGFCQSWVGSIINPSRGMEDSRDTASRVIHNSRATVSKATHNSRAMEVAISNKAMVDIHNSKDMAVVDMDSLLGRVVDWARRVVQRLVLAVD